MIDRRAFLASAGASLLPLPALAKPSAGHIVVVGGGFAGASCARWLKRFDPHLKISLIEANRRYIACPMSNEVLVGRRAMDAQIFGYDALHKDGIALHFAEVTAIDGVKRRLALSTGETLGYDRLVLAPGIALRWDGLPGYDQAAAEVMPHAWKAGPQTLLLGDQLRAMEDGGVVVISAPANPFRCPPGPYERASLIADFLKTQKPRSKLIILDAKDAFSKQKLFQAAWQQLYPGLIEWVPLSQGGKVIEVDAANKTLTTDFAKVSGAVVNVIPPQKAAPIADLAGIADRSGWCPIDPVTCESKQVDNIHVIGDAAIAGAMPKSAFAANAQAKVCAAALVALLRGQQPTPPMLINTCYSIVGPDYGISIAGVYRPDGAIWADVPGAGGTSPLDAPAELRAEEARLAHGWFETITGDIFV